MGYFNYVGAVVVSFEGIALVLPVNEALTPRLQKKFPTILCICMVGLAALYALFGAGNYYAYGAATARFATENMPPSLIKKISILAFVFSVSGEYFIPPMPMPMHMQMFMYM